ncbi:ankyrin repeat domain-containing protein [Wolbachia endosymbiont (group E) of Neria commutata]|uniref:ankyrin repeat domain-containing protein n=1 Tax=Wolbachia endosymbiont (group E) of Neria commutata TaxID=3066149 RepID=UPI0031331412
MVDENRKGNKLFLENIKEIYFDHPQAKNSTLYDLAWREKIDEWLSEEVVLTENQHKLDQGLLTALKSINCYYLDFYNHNDFLYDHADTKRLEEFLNANKNDPDLQVVLNLRRGEGKRTVLEKIATRNISAVYLFLKAGADPNIEDKKGKTPLHCAAKYDNTGIVDVLLAEKSINVNTKDNQGKTPLHYAVFHCHTEVISRLLTEEAIDINAQDNEGKAPLHHATFWEVDNEMIDILVNGGAKVDIPDNEGNTPLHYAANFGFVDSVGLLAAKSNNVNLINKNRPHAKR